MNFLNETDIATGSNPVNDDQPYKLTDANTALESLINEANGESSKVSDEQFAERPIDERDFETDEQEISPEESRVMQSTSLFVVETADEVLTRAIGAYAHCNETQIEKLKGSPQQLKKIANHFAPYFGTDKMNLPPWVMGLIATGIMLFDKFQIASEMRKVNLELEAEKEKTGKLERENKAIKMELEILKMTKQRDELQEQLDREKKPAA